jgi:integrase
MSDIRKRTGAKGTTYQVRYPSQATGSGYAYATFPTRKEAIEFRENAAARTAKSVRTPGIRTVADGLQKWLDVCEKEGRNGRDPVTTETLKHYQWRVAHINRYEWPRPLRELTTPDVVEFRSWLLRNFSVDVARKLLKSFHSMVLELITRGVLDRDIVVGVSIRSSSRYDEPVIIPTEGEVLELLAAADRLANSKNKQTQRVWERYRPILYLAADTGMRPQEYLVLPDFNLFDASAKVDRALESSGLKISVTKTPAGRRLVPVSPDTRDMVRHYSSKHGVPASKNTHGLLFPTSSGHWQDTRNWRHRGFHAACEEAGLMDTVEEAGKPVEKPRYTPYSLRHFYASMLIDQNVNLKRIQTLMGHEKIETTLNYYGHLIERKEAAAEKQIGMLSMLSRKSCGESVAGPL